MSGTEALKALIKFEAEGAGALAFLNVFASRLGILHGKVHDLNSTLGRMAIGGAAIVGGTMLLKTLWDTSKAAEGVNKVMTQMAQAGDSATNRQIAYNKAWSMTNDVVGKVSDNLEAISQMTPQFGLKGAMEMATKYRQTAVALATATGKDGNDQAYKLEQAIHQTGRMGTYDASGNLVRGADGREVVNQGQFSHMMDVFTAMIAASRGKIDADTIIGFTKQARTQNLMQLSDQGYFNLEGFLQTQKGPRAGTQLAALMNIYDKGSISKMGVHQLEDFSLNGKALVDRRFVQEGKGPNGVIIKNGGVLNSDLLHSDPMGWVWTVMFPAIKQTLEKAGKDSSDKATMLAMKQIKVTNTGGGFMSEGGASQAVDQMEADAAKAAMSVDQYQAAMTSAAANQAAFHDAMANLALTFGEKVLPAVINFTKGITKGITVLANVFEAHPELPKQILAVAAALGMVATVGGAGLVAGGVARGFGAIGSLIGGIGGGAAVVGGGEAVAGVGGALAADGAIASTGIGLPVAAALTVGILGYLGVSWLLHHNGGPVGSAPGSVPAWKAPPTPANQTPQQKAAADKAAKAQAEHAAAAAKQHNDWVVWNNDPAKQGSAAYVKAHQGHWYSGITAVGQDVGDLYTYVTTAQSLTEKRQRASAAANPSVQAAHAQDMAAGKAFADWWHETVSENKALWQGYFDKWKADGDRIHAENQAVIQKMIAERQNINITVNKDGTASATYGKPSGFNGNKGVPAMVGGPTNRR